MYRVHLQDFEGPLDLLLFFIQRDELDIYDIPIAQITDEFLEYVRLLKEIDLDNVGDFIYMAALLIGIKVSMLLPRPVTDEEGESIDPRQELVERLLEYMRYKEAAGELEIAHEERADFFIRGAASSMQDHLDDNEPEELVNTTVFSLIKALRHVLTEQQDVPVHEVPVIEYSVEEQHTYVLEQLRSKGKTSFLRLASHPQKGFVIATFLAILEMAKQGVVRLDLNETGDDFYIDPGCDGAGDTATKGSMTSYPEA